MKEIYLGGKNGSIIGNYVIVDDDDFSLVSMYNWHVTTNKSGKIKTVQTNIKPPNGLPRRQVVLNISRLIMGANDSLLMVDHIDGNVLNAQRCNLRMVTNQQNQMNRKHITGSSKYKGVHWFRNKWKAAIKTNTKTMYLGSFHVEEEAALAYNEAAIKYFGEFAHINSINT